MDYIARVVFNNGLQKTAISNTPGEAMDYVIYWIQSHYPVVYGDVYKYTKNGIPIRVYSGYTGVYMRS